jgi:hypothetical protein
MAVMNQALLKGEKIIFNKPVFNKLINQGNLLDANLQEG